LFIVALLLFIVALLLFIVYCCIVYCEQPILYPFFTILLVRKFSDALAFLCNLVTHLSCVTIFKYTFCIWHLLFRAPAWSAPRGRTHCCVWHLIPIYAQKIQKYTRASILLITKTEENGRSKCPVHLSHWFAATLYRRTNGSTDVSFVQTATHQSAQWLLA